MGSAPDIIPITDLRRDAAGVIARAVVSGGPVYVTQHGRATAVLLTRAEYERLLRRREVPELKGAGGAGLAAAGEATRDEVLERAAQEYATAERPVVAGSGARQVAVVATRFGVVDPETADFLAAEGFAGGPPGAGRASRPANGDASSQRPR